MLNNSISDKVRPHKFVIKISIPIILIDAQICGLYERSKLWKNVKWIKNKKNNKKQIKNKKSNTKHNKKHDE